MITHFAQDSCRLQKQIQQRNYKAYVLTSPWWNDLKVACKAAYFGGGKPEACFVCGKRTRVQIHHLRYGRNLDPTKDLVPVCGSCHTLTQRFPDGRVREPGLSPEEYRRRMQKCFRARKRDKLALKALVQLENELDNDAASLVWIYQREKPSGRDSLPPPPGRIPFLRIKRSYGVWLKENKRSNVQENARTFLQQMNETAKRIRKSSWRELRSVSVDD
jgi:hypothetical protein